MPKWNPGRVNFCLSALCPLSYFPTREQVYLAGQNLEGTYLRTRTVMPKFHPLILSSSVRKTDSLDEISALTLNYNLILPPRRGYTIFSTSLRIHQDPISALWLNCRCALPRVSTVDSPSRLLISEYSGRTRFRSSSTDMIGLGDRKSQGIGPSLGLGFQIRNPYPQKEIHAASRSLANPPPSACAHSPIH